jgi:hypothetical protein
MLSRSPRKHGALRQAAHGGDVGEGEPAEELEVHHLGELGIHAGELIDGFADASQVLVVG